MCQVYFIDLVEISKFTYQLHKPPYLYVNFTIKYPYNYTFLLPQEQYMFVYNAVRELLLLGDTSIKANDLKSVISQLKSKSDGKNSYQEQFDVSGSLLQLFT